MPIVHDAIRTNSDLDVYPTHEAKLGKGGYRTVANIAERDNIPFERCEEGMLVTVLDDDTNNNKTTTYILKQNTRDSRTWEKFNNGTVDANLTNRIAALETSSAKVDNEIVTLSNEISTKVSLDEHNNLVASLATYALKSDLNTLATKDELNDKLDSSVYTADKVTFATKDELSNKADLSSLDTLATKDELNDKLDSSTYATDKTTFATKDELNDKLDSSVYTTDKDTFTTKDELNTLVYTKSQVDEKIADAVTGGSVNLDGYVKKDEIANLATKDELNLKADSSSLDDLATKAELSSLATKDELNNKADISFLASLATKTELNNKADRSELDTKADRSDLQNLATKAELSSLATKDEVNSKLDSSVYTTDKDTFATKTQLEAKANKDEVYSKTEIDDNYTTTEQLNLALSGKADKSTIDSLATKVEVNEKIAKLATKDEMTSGLATKADSSIISTLATKAELSSLATKDELNLKADISSLDDLATKAELNNKADRSELDTKANSSDLQNLATKEKVNEINSTLTNAINTKANTDAVVNLTDDQTINGVKTFTSNITSPNITAIQNNLNTIFSSTSSPVKTQTTTKIITFGEGGDFPDLVSAINEARKYTSLVEIRLVSDLQINQRIDISAINGKHIAINFQNYKITNTSSKEVRFGISQSTICRIHNLNLENITFSMVVSSTYLTGNININNTLPVSGAIFSVGQSSTLNIAINATVTINSTGALFYSGGGGMLSFSNSSTVTTTTKTGSLFSVGNGGFMTFYPNVVINKPSELNLYNIAVNTPSKEGLILDKTGRI